jgi:dTDP-3,4-didehydro-2,6-dideoxy-alpha-D-glucose 3-reductase
MNAISVAVWGLGPHALKNILPALKMAPGIELGGVCSRNNEVVARAVSEFQCRSWSLPSQMLEDETVDAVYLSTPIGLHAIQGLSVLNAGKHLWCEKPLTETSEQASQLAQLSRERTVTLAEGFMYLYHPHFLEIRNLISSGGLGSIHTVTCRFGIPSLDRPGFRLNADLGGGAFLDIGSYPISAMVSLFPDPEPEILYAEIITPAGATVDFAGRATLLYGNGIFASLGWALGVAYRNEIDLWGSDGSLTSERIFSKSADYVPQIRILDMHGDEIRRPGTPKNHFVAMFEAFRALVEDPTKAEAERIMIGRRARLADRIRDHSRN